LAGAVKLAGGEQLFGADDAEAGAQLGPDEVLPTFAATEGEVGRLRPEPARQQDEQLRVLVVGVGAIMSTRLLPPSCSRMPANAATPPVPGGVICPRRCRRRRY